MEHAFFTVLNMSVAGGIAILLAVVLRLILRRGPKWAALLIWSVVALRLTIPVFFESRLAPIPAASFAAANGNVLETPVQKEPDHTAVAQSGDTYQSFLPVQTPVYTQKPIVTPAATPTSAVSTPRPTGEVQATAAPDPTASPADDPTTAPAAAAAITDDRPGAPSGRGPVAVRILFAVWLTGCGAMLLYALISYFLLKRKLASAVLLREGIYESEYARSPFTLGIFKPNIYVPFSLDEKRLSYVLRHEKAHLGAADHVWKALGFAVLSLHWFNPLVWLAYTLFCRDLELACDERVVKRLSEKERVEYSQTLLDLSERKHSLGVTPLAFGEGDAKVRIKSILSYKKPKAALIVLAVLLTCVLAACTFTANKPKDANSSENSQAAAAETPSPADTPTPTATPKPTFVPPETPDPAAFAEFSDPAFEALVRHALGFSEHQRIMNADLAELTSFGVFGEDIRSIAEAHKLPKLKKLILNGAPNVDFSELAGFKRIDSLVVINCGIKDISFVEPLTQLKEFTFDGAEVTDLSPLAGHHALQTLSFGSTGIVDLAPIADLPHARLTRLWIYDQADIDLSPVAGMTGLESLSLINCGVEDIGFIVGFSSLTELELGGNYICDISPLAALSKLCQVGLANNRIENIDVLFGLDELTLADLRFNPIPAERADALNKKLHTVGNENPVDFYPRDRERLACWPVDLDDDGTDEYFYLDLDWLTDDFISLVWVENAEHRLLGSTMQCGTGHVAYSTFAVVQSPEFGTCLMRIYPEWDGSYCGYELYDIVNGDLRSVRNVFFYNYDQDEGNLMDPAEAAAYEAEVNALLSTGCLLVSTDRYGVLTGSFVNLRTGEPFSFPYENGWSSVTALIRGFGSVGNGLKSHRAAMEAEGCVFFDDPVTYRFRINPDYVAGD